jgi:hypothetical protein
MSSLRCPIRRRSPLLVVAALGLAACGAGADGTDSNPTEYADSVGTQDRGEVFRYPPAPAAPTADAADAPEVRAAMDRMSRLLQASEIDDGALADLVEFGDTRHAWYVADLMRFFGAGESGNELVDAFESLTATSIADDPESERSVWLSVTNHLIAWDTPAYPDYRTDKAELFLLVEDRWAPFFGDADADIDWRYLSWGGVLIDDRELGDTEGCPQGCIPALDDPAVTDAAGGDWYPDDAIVFGLVEGDDALAIPKHIAEIHEMFNLTLGDRRFGVPYCTLCGAAQAYRTDDAVTVGGAQEVPVLRTSGLLSRSNKVMYDLRTQSVFDTFTGAAVSGPLHDRALVLEETTVLRTTWGEWKAEHPDTTIIAEDGGIGRSYPLDPLQGRDDGGPIFPIGPADDRLPEQELVVGVISPDGTPVAFPANDARAILAVGDQVIAAGVELVVDGGGLRALDADTAEAVPAHEAFWFAWSQFHPTTELWTP